MKRIIPIIALCIVASGLGAAETAPAGSGASVDEIRVIGLKRTRRSVVDGLLERYIGQEADDALPRRITATLLDTGIFEDIEVREIDTEAEKTTIEVTLKEKWTILPIPMFSSDSDGMTAGIAVIDMNAFGMTDKLFTQATIMPSGWSASAAYIDAPNEGRGLKKSISMGYQKERTEQVDIEDDAFRRYDASNADFTLGFGLPLGEAPASFDFGAAFRERGVDRESDDGLDVPDAGRVVSGSAGLEYRTSSWNGAFLSETSAAAVAQYAYGIEGDSFYALRFRAVFERPLTTGLRVVSRASAVWAPEAPPVFESDRSAASVAILPKHFSAPSMAGGSLGFEARLAAFKFGTLSGLANYQGAVVADGDGETETAHGPAAGIRLYLAKVAVPAMDLSFAYNVPTGLYQVVFGIGMRM